MSRVLRLALFRIYKLHFYR